MDNLDLDLIEAVLENNVASLKMLPKTTEWYRFEEPLTGNTLLHVAILHRKKEAFDFLLTIADFPLKRKNNAEETALDSCFGYSSNPSDEYFACELIKKGAAAVNEYLACGVTLLSAAISSNYSKTFKLLMEMGCDVNARNSRTHDGTTPLWVSLNRLKPSENRDEVLTTLLSHGARIITSERLHRGYNLFEYLVMFGSNHLQEVIYKVVVDECTSMDIQFEVLLILATRKSPLFRGTLNHVKKPIVNDQTLQYYLYLFVIDVDDLDRMIETHPDAIREVLLKATAPFNVYGMVPTSYGEKVLKNLNHLLESDLRDDTIRFLANINDRFLALVLTLGSDESTAVGDVRFLLSYGVKLRYNHLMIIYEKYGWGELLETMLHVEMEPYIRPPYRYRVVLDARLLLLFDVHVDVRQILQKAKQYVFKNPSYFLHYFADAKLRALCDGDGTTTVPKQSDVPLLVELARNTFRKFFVQTFAIKSASEFRSLVDKLHVAPGHKRIIKLEAELY